MTSVSSWSRLRIGLIAVASAALLAVGILVYGRVGTMRGAQARLFVAIDGALGLIRGSDVWLDGQRIGTVENIGLKPPGAPAPLVVVAVTVLQSDLSHFRTDSRASIKSGGSVLGTPVLYVISGTTHGSPLRDGDTLVVRPSSTATAQIDSTLNKLPTILVGFQGTSHDVSSIVRHVSGYRGAAITNEMRQLQETGARITTRLRTTGFADTTLRTRVVIAVADADSLLRLAQSGRLLRPRSDTALTAALQTSRQELSRLQATLASRNGTIGQIEGDSSIDLQLRVAQRRVNALIADVHKHPLRYIAF